MKTCKQEQSILHRQGKNRTNGCRTFKLLNFSSKPQVASDDDSATEAFKGQKVTRTIPNRERKRKHTYH